MARSNWSYMLLAFVMSVSLWYMVVGQTRVEQPITLRIEYSGMPSDLVIKKGLVQDITIQLRGPRGLIRTASDSRYTYTVDLSNIKKGINTVPLTTRELPFTRAFEVVEMKPSRLTLEVDSLIERQIGVDVHMREGTPAGIVVENLSWKPESVTVRGPESIVSELFRLRAEVTPPAQPSSKRVTTQASIVVPALVDAVPVQVDVSYNATIAMRELELTRTLNHAVDLEHFSVAPHQVVIRVSVPETEADDEALLQAITAYFEVPDDASYLSMQSTMLEAHVHDSGDEKSTKILPDMGLADHRTPDSVVLSSATSPIDSPPSDAPQDLSTILSPSAGDLAPSMLSEKLDEVPILAELPESEFAELPDSASTPLFSSDVDDELTNALSERVSAPESPSMLTELVLTTVPVRINAPSRVKVLEITPPEVELMLR